MKRWQSLLLGIAVSAILLWYALHGVDLGQMTSEITHINFGWALIAIILTVVSMWLRALRWRFLLNNRITPVHSFSISNAAYLFNTFLPLRLGEVVRAYMVTRLDPPIAMFTALSSVLVERLTDVLAIVLCFVIAILMAPVDSKITTVALLT